MTPRLHLNDGQSIPALGFGLWQVPQAETSATVARALGLGYRLFDGAAIYGNEAGLGEALATTDVPRDEVFVTSKVWNDRQGHDNTLRAVEESLARLRLDRLDLCLIHWPVPARDLYLDTWRALIRLQSEGRIRSIGVSNFNGDQIARIIGETGVAPVLNQVELHPSFPQTALRAEHDALGVVTQSWTPLGRNRCFDSTAVKQAAATHGKTPAQIVLRWHVQLGLSVIPRSTNPARMAENLELFDFALSAEEMAALAQQETGERLGPDPAHFA
jgi:2,5-diketo-D-gluconate reductase A